MAKQEKLFKKIDKAKTIKGLGRKRKEFEPRFGLRSKKLIDLRDDEERRLLALLDGDEKLVKRILKLKAQYPAGTTPEFIVYEWLERHHYKFDFQAMLFGGRRANGGLVPDFLVDAGGSWYAWQVQGEYWHSLALKRGFDLTVRLRLRGAYYRGVRIRDVVELWENDLYDKYARERVILMALQGVSARTAT